MNKLIVVIIFLVAVAGGRFLYLCDFKKDRPSVVYEDRDWRSAKKEIGLCRIIKENTPRTFKLPQEKPKHQIWIW